VGHDVRRHAVRRCAIPAPAAERLEQPVIEGSGRGRGRAGKNADAASRRWAQLQRRQESRRPSRRRRKGQELPRAGDAHVQQPALLGDLLILLGLPDRQQALVECRQVDGVPFEALCPVVRQEIHAATRSCGLIRAAAVEFGKNGVDRERRVRGRKIRQDVEEEFK
jgi:hypothetical protein